jgi:hypothetical protein
MTASLQTFGLSFHATDVLHLVIGSLLAANDVYGRLLT